uniref:Uncharacterized protein n=1 Tax=Anguilla anguilla TaxID=7936 RepID=A0A0E9PQH0_ANGAN
MVRPAHRDSGTGHPLQSRNVMKIRRLRKTQVSYPSQKTALKLTLNIRNRDTTICWKPSPCPDKYNIARG